jgi:hypothetical protein
VKRLEEELFEIFSKFPSKEHIEKICKPGSKEGKTCRFLVMEPPKGFRCAKATNIRKALDKKVKKDEMRAKGNNCGGLLDFIIEQQEKLKGKTVTHTESMPRFFAKGVLQGIGIRGELVYIKADWEDLGVKEQYYRVDDLEISVNNGITFATPGFGVLAGETKIFF